MLDITQKIHAARAAMAASIVFSAAVASMACAATDLPSTTGSVSGGPAATLSTLCPGADFALQDTLASAWRRVGYPSTVTVQLRVEGRQVQVTQVSGGLMPYRHAVSRAAARLDCDSQGSGSRTVAFNVRFVGPDAPEAGTQLASR